MPRYLFRVPLKGGRRQADNINMISTYKPGALENIIIHAASEKTARKRALKQNDAIWFLGTIDDENDVLIPPIHLIKREEDHESNRSSKQNKSI